MRKNCVLVAGAFIALVFMSCMSYPIKTENYTKNIHYWDESIPREESVELAFFAAGITPTSYNGIPVDWGKKPLVFLPPGDTVITVDLDKFDTAGVLYSGNTVLVWNFKAGDRFSVQGLHRDGKPGFLLYDLDVKKKWEEYDFFPFPEQGKTVLE
jgi:hypothetical protein